MTQVRRLLISLASGLLAILLAAGAVAAGPPSSSGIVVRGTDYGNGFYMNGAFTVSAITGAPASQACLGIRPEPLDLQLVDTPSGAALLHLSGADRPVWVYEGSLDDVCGAVFGGADPVPLAEGTVRETYTDNDLFVSGTRVNSFGSTATGTVVDGDGTSWTFVATGRLQWTLDGDLRILPQDIRLTPRGG
jgi:hypothetical protein